MAESFRPFSGLRGAEFRADLVAGLTLAAIAIPEQMATSRLAGFPPHVGFVAFIAGTLAFAALGSSRAVSIGADSTIAPIFAGGLAALAATGSPHYAALAALLALIVGGSLILAGLLRAGWIADLLSIPVVTGFLAGISVHIALSQAPAFFGLPAQSGDMQARVVALARHISEANGPTMLVGVSCLATIIVAEELSPRIPGALIALGGSTLAASYFGLANKGVVLLGSIAHGAPRLALPNIGAADVRQVFSLAIVVALLVMVQTSATSRAFARHGAKLDIDRDFLGAGAGSLLSGLFGAFAVNASPPRTAIVVESGGASQLSGLVAAAIVAGVLFFGGGVLARTPTAALAAVLMFVAYRIFRWRDMLAIFRATRGEFLLVAVTMLSIVLLPVQEGVGLAIILSLLHGVWTATRTRLIEYDRIPGTTVWWPASPIQRGERLPGVLVVAFQAPLSFLNADLFRRDMADAIERADGALKLLVLEASSIVEIDYSAALALRETIDACRERSIDVAVARLESLRAQQAFEQYGIAAVLGPGRIFHSVDEATKALSRECPRG
ncbi:MAG TPA: SulP family inorganic anion transporter [Methylocystis sp.]